MLTHPEIHDTNKYELDNDWCSLCKFDHSYFKCNLISKATNGLSATYDRAATSVTWQSETSTMVLDKVVRRYLGLGLYIPLKQFQRCGPTVRARTANASHKQECSRLTLMPAETCGKEHCLIQRWCVYARWLSSKLERCDNYFKATITKHFWQVADHVAS